MRASIWKNPVAPTWKTASGYATYKIKNQKLYVFPNYEKFKTSGNTEGLDINNIINSLGNLSDIGNPHRGHGHIEQRDSGKLHDRGRQQR